MLAALSACAADGAIESDEQDSTELTFPTPNLPHEDFENLHVDMRSWSGFGEGQPGVCDCTSEECVANYVNDTFGCHVCVSFQCEGDSVHACNPCDDPGARPALTPVQNRTGE